MNTGFNMNLWRVKPSRLMGRLSIPSSKSQSMRALLFALLANGKSEIRNLLSSPDVERMIEACRHLGALIEIFSDRVEIKGVGGKIEGGEDVIQVGNSGLIYRFIAAIAALSFQPIVITGDPSIRHVRPIKPLLEGLNQLGCEAYSLRKNGGAPILIKGPLREGKALIEGEDSQPVSALIVASAFASGPVEIRVKNPGETPWIDLTLNWLRLMHISYQQKEHSFYRLEGNSCVQGFKYTVPADFSSLLFPLAAALVTKSELTIENLDFSDAQGDKEVIGWLQEMGAAIELGENHITVLSDTCLEGISMNINRCIDALPILAVLGCFAKGKTLLTGARIARKKESDRISSIAMELKKMGARIEEREDGIEISTSKLQGASLYSREDHRIVLALAVAGLGAKGESVIHNTACANKTYPDFCDQMRLLGADIQQEAEVWPTS